MSDTQGLLQMALELEYARLVEDEMIPTETMEALAQDRVKRNFGILQSKLNTEKITPTLFNLFNIPKKSDVQKYIKEIKVEEFEFFLLIHNCYQIGYNHKSKFPEYIPSHLQITKSDRDNLHKSNFRPFNKKIIPSMRERRRIHVHLFEKGFDWHCFYFSYNDIDIQSKNHFSEGPHIHYVSHLWTFNKEKIWDCFDTRFTNIGGDSHIKFTPYHFPVLDMSSEENLRKSETPMLAAIDPVLPFNRNASPIPLAQLTTRGFWVGDISTRP